MDKSIQLAQGDRILSLPCESFLDSSTIFSKSFILLVEHDAIKGSLGFVMNKPLGFQLSHLFPKAKGDFPVFLGGPVAQNQLFFLHNRADIIAESEFVAEGVYFGGNFDEVLTLIAQGDIASNEIKFYQGYAAWSTGQLADEFKEDFWIKVNRPTVNELFSIGYKKYWTYGIQTLGKDYAIWENAPENPTLN